MIPDYRQCKHETYGYRCRGTAIGFDYCEEHDGLKCVSCGKQSTHGCPFEGQFVCGAPLCDECVGATDKGPSGAWGFLNHVHIKRGDPLPSELKEKEKQEEERLRAQSAALGVSS